MDSTRVVIKDESYYILLDIIQNYLEEYSTGCDRINFVHNESAYTMLNRICSSVITTNKTTFDEIIDKYDIEEIIKDIYLTLYNSLNWGQIIASVSFGAYLSKVIVEKYPNDTDYVRRVSETITEAILANDKDWFTNQGYWKGIFKFDMLTELFKITKYTLCSASVIITCMASMKILSSFFKI
ncbi:Bcl-2-like protein [Turkeypox virus]|uniref:Apoptosis regulator Bcl-2 homolog n=1 Tax=Turkeypox virus TaxID=336486 RepID=A0A0M3ZJZ2_9POXV|nr:Bcl-2-like protein [Turkeypox virus]ALA62394.1 Bcl-2-like protein [Turkeypox virus]